MNAKYAIFLSVLEEKSFSKAAEKTGYSQSAISQAVKALEEELNTVLLTRGKEGITLTKDGEAYLPYIQAITASESALINKQREMQGFTSQIIRIGTFTSVSKNLLPSLIQSFKAKYPTVRFELLQGEYNSINEKILSGALDFGFFSPEHIEGLQYETVYTDTMMAVLPKDHPLAKKKIVSLKDLRNDPFIQLSEGLDSIALEAFHKAGIEPNLQYVVTDDYTIMEMVQKHMGISLLYRLTLANSHQGLAIRPIKEHFERTIAMGWRDYDTLPLVTKTFIETIRRESPQILVNLAR